MIEVRKARTESDLSECHWMQMTVFTGGEHRDTAKDHWWVARVDGEVAGFACLRIYDGAVGYLALAGVLEKFRGRGIQKKLIRARERYAKAQGCTSMITYTAWKNWSSANSLIREEYTLYTPASRLWGLPYSLYFRKTL
jgi:GNAT superfamily N-acetyltransferase